MLFERFTNGLQRILGAFCMDGIAVVLWCAFRPTKRCKLFVNCTKHPRGTCKPLSPIVKYYYITILLLNATVYNVS